MSSAAGQLARKTTAVLTVAGLALALFLVQYQPPPPGAQVKGEIRSVSLDRVKALFPEAADFEREPAGAEPSAVRDGAGNLVGFVAASSPWSDGFIGYGGPVPLLVGLDLDGRVKGVVPLANNETVSFLEYISEEGLFARWDGLLPDAAVETPVDAVTEATLSSAAVIQGMRTRMALLAGTGRADEGVDWMRWLKTGLAAAVLAWALAGFFFPQRMKRGRLYLLAAAVVVLGLWQGQFLSLSLFNGWLLNGIPLAVIPVLAATALLAVLLPLLTDKSFYCVHVCPYGAAQELLGKAGLTKWSLPPRLAQLLLHTRPAFLFVVVALLLVGVSFDLTEVEPFSAFLFRSASAFVLALAGVFLLLSLFLARPWCRYACPTGEILEMLRRPALPAEGTDKAEPSGRGVPMRTQEVVILLLVLLVVAVVARPHVEKLLSSKARTEGTMAVLDDNGEPSGFLDEPVERGALDRLLAAAMQAPRAGGTGACEYLVLADRKQLDLLAEAVPSGDLLKKAPNAILIAGNLRRAPPGKNQEQWVQECSAAAQNVLLAARALELKGAWLRVYPNEKAAAKVKELFRLPEDVLPFAVLALGKPLGAAAATASFDPEAVHWNIW
jgi:nitroreductase